jgi:hypothetical protein
VNAVGTVVHLIHLGKLKVTLVSLHAEVIEARPEVAQTRWKGLLLLVNPSEPEGALKNSRVRCRGRLGSGMVMTQSPREISVQRVVGLGYGQGLAILHSQGDPTAGSHGSRSAMGKRDSLG